jgi:hypothetical protein
LATGNHGSSLCEIGMPAPAALSGLNKLLIV